MVAFISCAVSSFRASEARPIGVMRRKKANDPVLEDYERLQSEIIRDKVSEVFRTHPCETFRELAKDFYYSTSPDGYEAYRALRELFGSETAKRKIIDSLIADEEEGLGPLMMPS